FIDNDDYFEGPGTKVLETESSPEDNDERSMFFVRGVIETVRKLRWDPTVIHCTGWITALAPLYIRHLYQDDPGLSRSLVVYSLRPESFEGKLDARFAEKLKMAGFTDECLQSLGGGDFDWMTLNKLGIDHSDAIVVTAPDIPAGLVEYARQSGKPVLEYPGPDGEEATTAAYHDFYQSILSQKENDSKSSD
ncbi:glycogen/starch synthase, partial [Paramuribaculum intestinale]